MTSDPDESRHVGVNENEEFCCMFKSRLGSNSILFGAEMDGYQLNESSESQNKKPDDINLSTDGHFVEMKTSRLIENDRQHTTFCWFKTQKWWAQSFMVCTHYIYNNGKRPKSERSDFGRLGNGLVVKSFGLEKRTSEIETKLVPNQFGTGFVRILRQLELTERSQTELFF